MKKILLFLFLCTIGFVIAVMADQDVNLTSLLVYQDNVHLHAAAVVPGNSVRGEFTATENNLAILRVRLRTYNRFNTTHLIFRLKKKGDPQWLVTNTYALDRVPDGLLYPFGFPAISDSKGNVYEFELSSPDGTADNAIGVAGGYHGVAAQYVQSLPLFVREKIVSTVSDPYSIVYFSLFFVPACMFFFKKYRLQLFIYMAVIYAYLPVSMNSNVVLFIAAAELFAGSAFFLGIGMLVQIPIIIGIGNTLAATRLATLVFFSLVVGVIMAIREKVIK